MKICDKHNYQKEYTERVVKGKIRKSYTCKLCVADYRLEHRGNALKYAKGYRETNSDKISEYKINYYQENKEKIIEDRKEYYEQNKDQINTKKQEYYQNNRNKALENQKEYYKNNKEQVLEYQRLYSKDKRQNDPAYKLRKNVSNSIYVMLKTNASAKNGESIRQFLPYTIQELKDHLEKQFEPWMTWNNWGTYNYKTWNDNDLTTWTWQIDHIVPHSTFNYTSMEDRALIDCWALSNLRPLSAKQNYLDGMNRIRH